MSCAPRLARRVNGGKKQDSPQGLASNVGVWFTRADPLSCGLFNLPEEGIAAVQIIRSPDSLENFSNLQDSRLRFFRILFAMHRLRLLLRPRCSRNLRRLRYPHRLRAWMYDTKVLLM